METKNWLYARTYYYGVRVMTFKPSSFHKFFFTYICPRFYGGGAPSTPSQTTQTVNQNSIPAELLPYVKNMLNKAEPLTQEAYQPYSTNAGDYVAPFSPLQQQAQTSAAGLQTPGQFAPATQMAGLSGIGQLGTAQTAQNYGAQGAGYGQNAANVGAAGGLGYGAQSANLGMTAAGTAGQGYGAGAQYAQQATDPNSVSAYMSPYIQNVMQQQGRELNRNYDISGAEQQGRATQAGAFGGSREALMAAENERNRNMALNKMQAEGLQSAYTAANANQQFGANLNLQGMQAGNQALQTGLQGIGQGITGVNTALQGYQQGVSGAQAGLAGVQGAQQGYAGASNTAATLGNLGSAELAAQTGVLNTQNTVGGQQQAQQQQAINQSVLNYQNAQQYPYMQLGFMSDLLRGTPTGNTTQTTYQAQPGMASQIGGLAATGLGAYAALKAKGGPIEDKGYKSGGIVGYKIGGDVEESMRNKLEDLDKPHLVGIIQKNESPIQTGLAREVYATKLARGGIVGFAEKGDVKENKNPLLKRHEKMSELQSEAAPVVNKTDMGIGVANTPVQAATLGPMSDEESLKNMALNQAEGYKPPVQTSGIAAVEGPSVADKVLFEQKQKAVSPFNLDQAMADQQQDVEKLRADANKSEDELIAEDRKRREAQLGPDTATAEYRKSVMDERANAPDEARRQMGMRLMEFGANWASTPGAPLVAGMKALREGLPSVMEDTKANKKAMKDINASIYALDHAARLEAEGYMDRAAARKEKASELFMKAAPAVIDAGVKKQTLMIQEQEQKNTAAHYKAIEGNQAAALAQSASQFAVTSAQPTAAGMKEQAIQAIMKEKGVPYGAAYGEVEAFGSPATAAVARGEKALTALYTKSNSDAQVAETNAMIGTPEDKVKAQRLREVANYHQLNLINFGREQRNLNPLDSLPNTSPRIPTPVGGAQGSQNIGINTSNPLLQD